MDTKTRRSAATGVAILFLAGFLGLLGNGLWKQASGDWRGHIRLAAGPGRLYVQAGGEIFILKTTGRLIGRSPLPAGLRDSLTGMQALPDGRVMLVRSQPAAALLCEPLTWKCSPLAPRAMRELKYLHRAILDDTSEQLMVSDAAGHLWAMPLASGPALEIDSGRMNHPEGLAFDRTHRLWVADSGHHRLAAFARQGGQWTLERTLPASDALAKPSVVQPMNMALGADDNWWVVQSDRFQHSAALLIYRPGHGAIGRVALPPGAFPDAVAALGKTVLVSDTRKFRIYGIDVASRKATVFGDTRFRGLLTAIGAHRELAQVDEWWGELATLAAVMIIAAIVATPPEKRLKMPRALAPLEASSAAMPELNGIHWLKKDIQFEQRLRQSLKGGWVILPAIAFMGCLPYLQIWLRANSHPVSAQSLAQFRNLVMVAASIAGVVFIQLWAAIRSLRTLLGTDGSQLLVKLPNGQILTVAAERLIYDQRSVAFDDHAFALVPIYDRQEVESYLAPLLSRATKVTSFQMQRYRLAHHEGTLMASYFCLVLCLALFVLSGAWHAFWAEALKSAGAR